MNNKSIKTNQIDKQIICSVCIATFKRPALLRKLIQSLFEQKKIEDIILEIIIVDNDIERSAKEIVSEFSDTSSVTISYYEQPIQNIALTRNMSIDKSSGHYIAIIDDDETADNYWIRNLIDTIENFNADAVFGYVLPVFPPSTPVWIQQREIYFMPMGKTGDPALSYYTTNCMIKANKVKKLNLRFDPEYGLSGGSDRVFFDLLSEHKFQFVVCREAITYEKVPAHRTKLKSICSRQIQKGNNYGRIVIASGNNTFHKITFFLLIKSLLGIGYFGLQSIIFLPFKRKWIFSLIRLCLNIGKLLAIFKVKLLIYTTEYNN
ncbi:MAG: glycosyltransferase [Ignavibacteriaceae bacterium]|nr:glycosyltransferase [Ignavibacteriaceae bacterium]